MFPPILGTKDPALGLNAGAFILGLKGVAPTLRDLYDTNVVRFRAWSNESVNVA